MFVLDRIFESDTQQQIKDSVYTILHINILMSVKINFLQEMKVWVMRLY